MTVYKAINGVLSDLSKLGIAKKDKNTFDGYMFRGIDSVYNALSPLLAKHGLCILPRVMSRVCEERMSKDNKPMFYVTVDVELDFIAAEDGSKHTIKVYGEAMDRGDKATNKAMTAAYKYGCFEVFCIPTEGDDADAESPEIQPKVKVSSKKITEDVWDSLLNDEQRVRLTTIANAVKERLKEGDVALAVKTLDDAKLDADEKTGIWSLFDSEQRSAIRGERHDAKREKQISALTGKQAISLGSQA